MPLFQELATNFPAKQIGVSKNLKLNSRVETGGCFAYISGSPLKMIKKFLS